MSNWRVSLYSEVQCNMSNGHIVTLATHEQTDMTENTNSPTPEMSAKNLLEVFLSVSLNSLNSVTKIFVITVKGLEPST